VKKSLSEICLAVSIVFFFLGFFILCECPGWYAVASALAAVPAWKGIAQTRRWGVIALFASLAMTIVHAIMKFTS
jgi:hypothetical protein